LQSWYKYNHNYWEGSIMTREDVRRAVKGYADSASVALWEGLAAGIAEAEATLRGLPHRSDYPFALPLLARMHMRNYWIDGGAPAGWVVGGNPRLMGQTLLLHKEANIEMRLLKERRRTYPGGVPVAGTNAERRQYWQAMLPFNSVFPNESLVEDRLRLLLLWDRVMSGGEGRLTLRIVRTLGPGIYGQRVPLDMNYEIKQHGGIFDHLRFPGDPQDDDLFADIDWQENEGDDLAQ